MRYFALIYLVFFLCVHAGLHAADRIKIASLHPVLSDMARSVGGDAVEVVNLFPQGANLHSFDPSTAQLAAAAQAEFILACGKNIEPYLPKLRDSLPSSTTIIELGKDIPDVMLPASQVPDPHWWNSPANMKRATQTLLSTLIQHDPSKKQQYEQGAQAYTKLLDELSRTAKISFARIPQQKRVLVTGHAAMSHFCKEFNFIAVPLFGVSKESEGDTASLAILLKQLRRREVSCIFTELTSSPKMLENIAREIGASTRPINMDGVHQIHSDYASIFRDNVRAISEGLSAENTPAS